MIRMKLEKITDPLISQKFYMLSVGDNKGTKCMSIPVDSGKAQLVIGLRMLVNALEASDD